MTGGRLAIDGKLALACAVAVFAQAPVLQFETVTIRPSLTPTFEERKAGTYLNGLKIEGRNVTLGQMPLATMVAHAYGVKPERVVGSPKAERIRFDIIATMPGGATREQFAEMLRHLLVKRFDLVARRESREMPVYALSLGPEGHKLTRVADGTAPVARSLALEGRAGTEFTDTWEQIIERHFRGAVDRPIVDLTGLSGMYSGVFNTGGARRPAEFREGWSAMGLVLEPRNMAQDVIVVERIETYPSDQ